MAKALVNNWIILVMIAIAVASFWAVIYKKAGTAGMAGEAGTAAVDKGRRIELIWDIFPKNLVAVKFLP